MTAMKDRDAEDTASAGTDNLLTMMSVELNTQARRSLQADQQIIFNLFLSLVRTVAPELVLAEFRSLFITPNGADSKHQQALDNIISSDNETEFINTLKRSCYILINKWHFTRHYQAILQLIELFNSRTSPPTRAVKFLRLNNWLNNFVKSKDYEEMKIFALKHENSESVHWSDRYTSYLLVPQYLKHTNPLEQRQAAKTLAQQLKEKFKFDLAMYTARFAVTPAKKESLKNPTSLGYEVLEIIKRIVSKKGEFNYANFANIFINQTQDLNYRGFKLSLQKYLMFCIGDRDSVINLSAKLGQKLKHLYESDDERQVDRTILLKTCHALIDYLTMEAHQPPSEVFILLIYEKKSLSLVIILLKIVLICQQSRTYLETRIAELIQYYKKVPEADCEWVIEFVEIFNIVFTIYNEDVEYNLIKMYDESEKEPLIEEEKYRVFSQIKRSSKLDGSQKN